MRDRFGRTIDYMRVSVTDRCNLRCVYCMPAEGVASVPHEQILTFDEIARVCRVGAELGIRRIKLTGGEPLVRRGLPELVGMLKGITGIEQVTLTTNGTLLKEQINGLVSNGLDAVNISIDTLHPERYREITRGGSVEKALEGLDAAAAVPGLSVKVNCVPLKATGSNLKGTGSNGTEDEEYIRLALLAKEGKADVRFIEMMPIGLGKHFAGRGGDEILGILEKAYGKAEPCTGRLGNGPAEYVQFPGFRRRIGFISAVSHQFCGGCNRVRLTAEGYLKPCLQYERGTDLKTLLRGGAGDPEIRAAMEKAFYEKPAHHQFGVNGQFWENSQGKSCAEETLETKEMSRIGG